MVFMPKKEPYVIDSSLSMLEKEMPTKLKPKLVTKPSSIPELSLLMLKNNSESPKLNLIVLMPESKLDKPKEILNMLHGLNLMLNIPLESKLVKMLLTSLPPFPEVPSSSNSKEESNLFQTDSKK